MLLEVASIATADLLPDATIKWKISIWSNCMCAYLKQTSKVMKCISHFSAKRKSWLHFHISAIDVEY